MDHFKLSAIDPDLGCPFLQALIPGPDINLIRTLIGLDSHDDPDGYILDPDEARAVAEQFGIAFAPITPDTLISRVSFDLDEPLQTAPYLNHTGIKLFLLLDGAKPLAIFSFEYPVYDDDDKTEDLFEPHVHAGKIINEWLRKRLNSLCAASRVEGMRAFAIFTMLSPDRSGGLMPSCFFGNKMESWRGTKRWSE